MRQLLHWPALVWLLIFLLALSVAVYPPRTWRNGLALIVAVISGLLVVLSLVR